jgi:hypothetical protein
MGAAPWAVVASGTTPIVSGVLTNWSPAAPGYRMLRLTVTDACGHAATDVHLMYADQGPQATINYPNDGGVIGGSSVCIDGRVSHGVCSIDWLVEYRPVPGGWTYLANGAGSVHNLPLTHWNTTLVADGPYEIRVSASTIGGTNSHTVGVTVDNTSPDAEITDPMPCDWITGVVPVFGTADDVNLNGWSLQYTGDGTSGWVTINSGGAPVVGGFLGNWNTNGLDHCAYTLRVVVTDTAKVNCSGNTHRSEYDVSVNVGCPADVDGDGDVDLSDLAALLGEYGTTCP